MFSLQRLSSLLTTRTKVSTLQKQNFSIPFSEVIATLYRLWKQKELKVYRRWGDAEKEILYRQNSCLLPSDELLYLPNQEKKVTLSLVTWNINSIRARLELLESFLKTREPDIVCLQETKVVDHQFPNWQLEMMGYHSVFCGQKSYNGVAILSRHPIDKVQYGFQNNYDSENQRFIRATILGVDILNFYVPQGQTTESAKFLYKLEFFRQMQQELEQYPSSQPRIVAGDLNVALDERDVVNAQTMAGKVSFHPKEHAEMRQLMKIGELEDCFRKWNEQPQQYTWWDYRTRGFEKNEGMRIDYIFGNHEMASRCRACVVDTEHRAIDKASDHAPVMATFEYSI